MGGARVYYTSDLVIHCLDSVGDCTAFVESCGFELSDRIKIVYCTPSWENVQYLSSVSFEAGGAV